MKVITQLCQTINSFFVQALAWLVFLLLFGYAVTTRGATATNLPISTITRTSSVDSNSLVVVDIALGGGTYLTRACDLQAVYYWICTNYPNGTPLVVYLLQSSNLQSGKLTVTNSLTGSNAVLCHLTVTNDVSISNLLGSFVILTNSLSASNITTGNLTVSNQLNAGRIVVTDLIAINYTNQGQTTLSVTNGLSVSNLTAGFIVVTNSIAGSNVMSGKLTVTNIASLTAAASGDISNTNNVSTAGVLSGNATVTNNLTGSNAVLALVTVTNTLSASNITCGRITATNTPWTTLTNYTSGLLAFGTPIGFTNAHGLGGVPKLLYAKLVCVAPDLGYSIGDEISSGWRCSASYDPFFTLSADTVNVYLIRYATSFALARKDTGAPNNATTASWQVRIYASRY